MHSVCLLFIKAATNCFLNLWSIYFIKWQKIVKKCQRFSYCQYSTTLHWFLFYIYLYIAYTFAKFNLRNKPLKTGILKKGFYNEKKRTPIVKFESLIQLFTNVLVNLGYSPCFTHFYACNNIFHCLIWLFNTFWLHNLQSQNILDLLTESMK